MNKAKQNATIIANNLRQDQLVTLGDLVDFKAELLEDIKRMQTVARGNNKQWLKSNEVRKLLSISPGTLQTLRNNGTIRFTKISNMIFYNIVDINKMMETHRSLNF